ncbi:MAG: HEAT repeat domain-containing protein [Candidatus Heimdallarchaeota archaeon]
MDDINKEFNFDLHKFLIENSQDENIRLKSINCIKNLDLRNQKTFQFLENILISDSNEDIRRLAFKSLILINSDKVIKSVVYAILNESGTFLVDLIDFLYRINPLICKQILRQKILQIENKTPHTLLKNNNLDKLTIHQLRELLLNHQLNKSLENLYFHRHSVPLALDLYGIE